MSRKLPFVRLFFATGIALAEGAPEAQRADEAKQAQVKPEEPKELQGISILGNQEAPKALVIVPWKSSELGAARGTAPLLDDSRTPVDREVFLRELSYYEIRTETTHDAARVTPAAQRSKS